MATFEELDEKAVANLARSMHKLLANPEVSSEAKRLIMKADPSVKFQDVIAQDATREELKKRDEKLTELEGKLIEQEARDRLAAFRQQARDRGLDPAEVEKVVTEYKVADWEAAMKIAEALRTAAPASSEAPTREELPKEDQKKLWSDPDNFARDTAKKVIDEFARGAPRGRTRAA